ncbi:AAA family ATPase [Streptomyces sp. NPDC006632]|uniref:AAA family ATPase n=1 Tax=Streptomyces sp. NPDC006632 TaxID=3157182 RepID=UPI0033B5CB35
MTAGRKTGQVREGREGQEGWEPREAPEAPAPNGPGRAVPTPRTAPTVREAGAAHEENRRHEGSGPRGAGAGNASGVGNTAGAVRGAVRDLRGRPERTPPELLFDAGDVVVVSGLPGSGKTTLMRRTVTDRHIDSQDTRVAWQRRLPGIPYALYRPLTRTAHFVRTWWALRSGDSLVVHDCGTQAWVRHWLGRGALRRGRALRLVVLDVPAGTALEGQAARGRWVSAYAFARHRGAARRLIAQVEAGRLPTGCATAVLLDRESATVVRRIGFAE